MRHALPHHISVCLGCCILSLVAMGCVTTEGPVRQRAWQVPDVGLTLVWVEALDGWCGRYEVSNREFRFYSRRHDSGTYMGQSVNENEQPVVRVSLMESIRLANWITKREKDADRLPSGYSYRLPTRDEWAVMAQCAHEKRFPWGNGRIPQYGNFCDDDYVAAFGVGKNISHVEGYDDGYSVSCPVTESGTNEWGLFGMAGNVYEYVLWGQQHFFAGGSWRSNTSSAHCFAEGRGWLGDAGSPDTGIRIVLLPEATIYSKRLNRWIPVVHGPSIDDTNGVSVSSENPKGLPPK